MLPPPPPDGPYSKREGLMGVEFKGALYMSGGRTNFGTGFSDEVWRSADFGTTWELVSSKTIPPRAYHVHLVVDDCQIITGGQTFFTFYNDVWKSCDAEGKVWEQVTDHAEFTPRAGLAATVTASGAIIVAGGCYNKNGNPAARSFRGDVWKSVDAGATWTLQSDAPGWVARSGPRLIESEAGRLLIIAGEIGFTDDTQLVDIWSSEDDGATWSLLTESPGFSPRSGHGVVVAPSGEILVVAGWPHLHDLWESVDGGKTFEQTSNAVWNCDSEDCGKFDFWPVVTGAGKLITLGGSGAYSTFGKLWRDTWEVEFA